jgi:transcriptional regulator GlxA family with amidase domain
VVAGRHPQRFGFLTLPNYSMIACTSAIEALRMANRSLGDQRYHWWTMTLDGTAAIASNGLTLGPAVRPGEVPLDILLVCGGVDVRRETSRRLTAVLRGHARNGVMLGALCTGSFALAEARLLAGRRCAIHWEDLAGVREEFPDIDFVEDLYAIDGDRITCTGGIAPLHMMLRLIGDAVGPGTARAIADQFIVERNREATEPQAALRPARAPAPVLEALRLIERTTDAPLPLEHIAGHAGISRRQLERLFRTHLGQSPAAYITGMRLDRARTMIRQTGMPVMEVGLACGFVSANHFSTAYRGRFGCSPRDDRKRASW